MIAFTRGNLLEADWAKVDHQLPNKEELTASV
jgi:hypothetical protein